MRIAICILHYGRPERTDALYRQLLESEAGERDAPRVLDNASPWPFPDAWVRLEENRYWAGALDWAVEAFAAEGFSHLWFCNNDVLFTSRRPYLARARARLECLEKTGRVALLSPACTANPYHGQMVVRPGGGVRAVPYIDGIAPLLSLECVRELGLDCRDNPEGYGVDVWLSLRARRAGWLVAVDDAICVKHHYHSTAREVPGFLDAAARKEDAYLRQRMGKNWKETLGQMAGEETG